MADATKELSIIISAKDEATRVIQGVSSSFSDLVSSAQTGSFIFAGALGLVGKSIIDAASDMQQAKVAFTVFEGSAAAASKTLKQLSDFAKVTPFTFPTVTEAAKQLMAYGVEADNLIPTLKTLGDISAGVGTDKLPQLILAFGQVKAKTTLAGTELRQFTETGIPLIQALVNEINNTGGAMVKTATKTKGSAEEIGNLNDKLAIAKQRLAEVTSNTKSHQSSIMSAQDAVQNYEQKLAKATETTGGFSQKTKVTAADIQDMVSKGQISFDMVQKALEGMTTKGGQFFNLMDAQSRTFKGVMSNISDQLVRVALNIAGMSTEADTFGNVIKGGAFDILSQGAQRALDVLNALEPKISGIISAFVSNQGAIGLALGILVGGLLSAAIAIGSMLAPLLTLMAIFGALGAIVGTVAGKFHLFNVQGGNAVDWIKGKFAPMVDVLQTKLERIGQFTDQLRQILAAKLFPKNFADAAASWGNFFDNVSTLVKPKIERIGQLIQLLKNKFAFGNADSAIPATWINVFENISQHVKKVMDEVGLRVQQLKNLLVFGTIASPIPASWSQTFAAVREDITAVAKVLLDIFKPAIDGLAATFSSMGPILTQWAQIWVLLKPILMDAAIIIGGILLTALIALSAFLVGLTSALGPFLTAVATVFTGIVQVVTGFFSIVIGLFTANGAQITAGWNMLWQGIWNIISGFVTGIINTIWGFVSGIIHFFQVLYDTLVGHSIVPDMVNAILGWFDILKTKGLGIFGGLISGITNLFSGLLSSASGWGSGVVHNLISGIKGAIQSAGKLAGTLLGSLGISMNDLAGFQHGGFVPGSYNQAVPAMLHGGERVIPRNGVDVNPNMGKGGSGSVSINISGQFNIDSDQRVQELSDKIIRTLNRQNELAAKGIGF